MFKTFSPLSRLKEDTASDFGVGLLLAGIAGSSDWNRSTTGHTKRAAKGNQDGKGRTQTKSVGNRLFVARRGPVVDRQYQKKGCKESFGF